MEKTEIKKPTIQERIASRVNEILDPVEAWLDRYNNNPDRFNPETLKLVPLFKKEKVGGVHARKIQERFEEPYKEFKELLDLRKKNLKFKELDDEEDFDSDDRQLLEAYEDVSDETIKTVSEITPNNYGPSMDLAMELAYLENRESLLFYPYAWPLLQSLLPLPQVLPQIIQGRPIPFQQLLGNRSQRSLDITR